jgi:hypothetical protein
MDWQPIETAPKDGTEIDIWGGVDVGRVAGAFWGQRSADKAQREHFGFDEFGWCREGEDGWIYPITWPTHWMPLPAPPA